MHLTLRQIRGAVAVAMLGNRVARAQTVVPRYSGGIAVAQRDVRDYAPGVRAWGYTWSAAVEAPVYAHASFLATAARSRFGNRITSPPLTSVGARLARTRRLAVAGRTQRTDDWDPTRASNGDTDLTMYQLTVDYRLYLVRHLGIAGPYLGAGFGIASLSATGMRAVRSDVSGAIGFTSPLTRHVGVFAEGRYDWLAFDASESPKSPKWLATPIRVGFVIR